jgi:hypothetical protein
MINDLVDLNRLYIKKLHSNAILKWNKQVTFCHAIGPKASMGKM